MITDETTNPEPFGPDNAPMIVEMLTANPQLRAAVLEGLEGVKTVPYSAEYWHQRFSTAMAMSGQSQQEVIDLVAKLRLAESELAELRAGYPDACDKFQSQLRAMSEQLAAERARVKELTDAINIDRTGLAAGLNHVKAVVKGYQWIADGEWGSYSYEERTSETLRREVGYLIKGACDGAERALKASGERATKAVRSPQQPAPPPAEQAKDFVPKSLPDCPHGVGLCTSNCPRAKAIRDGGGASPGERVTHEQAQLLLELATDDKFPDARRKLRGYIEAAEAERGRLMGDVAAALEALQLTRWNQEGGDIAVFFKTREGQNCAEVNRAIEALRCVIDSDQSRPSTAARSGSVGGEDNNCHKCGEAAQVNDGDDGLGPPVCVNCYDDGWAPAERRLPPAQPLTLADVDRRIAQLARAASMRADVDHHSTRRTLERLQEVAEKALSDSEVANGS